MADIRDLKKDDLIKMQDFLETVEDYGHIYHYPDNKLNEPFKKITDGIDEILEMMNDSWEM